MEKQITLKELPLYLIRFTFAQKEILLMKRILNFSNIDKFKKIFLESR